MGSGEEAIEVGGEARELPLAGGRVLGLGGLAGLPEGMACFSYFQPLNIGQSTPQVVLSQDHFGDWGVMENPPECPPL